MGQYQDALDYIFSYVNYEKQERYSYTTATFDLARVAALLDRLGRPQDRFHIVHIAGTKGKGSTAAMTESVLRAAGYRTGLYTSPHLHTFRERMRVGGMLIPRSELVSLLERSKAAIEATQGITTFEIMTALAFAYFAEQHVEWAVVEVGLGGRLDATNVVHPDVCAITSISYDHVDLLGHTLALIAAEKAGIIKPGVPVVSAPQAPEAMDVIRKVARETGVPLVVVGEDWTWESDGMDPKGQFVTVQRRSDGFALTGLRIPLLGRHQGANVTTVVAILDQVRAAGGVISDQALRAGLAQVRWPGRFEILSHHPVVVVDGAHNVDSALKLRTALADVFPVSRRGRLLLIFGASTDKDIPGILQVFVAPHSASNLRAADMVIVTRSGHPRQTSPARLAEIVRGLCAECPLSIQDSLEDAIETALLAAKPEDVICITGSLFVVARARSAWAKRHPEAFSDDDWVFEDEGPGVEVADTADTLPSIGVAGAESKP